MYIAPQHLATLTHNQLTTFDAMWNMPIDWFEPPNERRGGWSGVGKLQLQDDSHNTHTFFLKKQHNHGRRTWRHPVHGEPTFRREFANLQLLNTQQIVAPMVACYAEKVVDGKPAALLMTVALTGYVDLEWLANNWLLTAKKQQKMLLIQKVAQEIKRFHDAGWVHRALYPKHIFVKNADTEPEIALIDCEKMRHQNNESKRTIFDLAAIHRHSPWVTNTQRLCFLKHYLNVNQLNQSGRLLTKQILQRAARK